MSLLQPASLFLIFSASIGYAAATIAMKSGTTNMTAITVAIIALGLVAAVLSEVAILRTGDLGPIYVAILGVETMIVLLYAWYIGEAPSLRQLGGAGLVLTGLVVVGH